MPNVVIADTSCFIILSNIDELDILQKLYKQITTTPDVALEFGEPLPDWIIIKSPTDHQKQLILEQQVDKGEASAIALALEIPKSLIVLDDLEGRTLARHLGITMTGTIGVLVKAKLQGLIPSIKPLLTKIRQTNFRISPLIEASALKEAGEY
jgi:predicted nucleic acid-binding protein